MENEDYEWQKKVIKLWEKNGRKGIIKAVPGAGKTRAGFKVIDYIWKENPDAKILIVCPTKQIISQWKELFKETSIDIKTYFWASKQDAEYDLIIFDECHSLLSPVRQKALNIKCKWVLGLSATPEKSYELIGKIFLEVDWEEANVAPFNVEYIVFNMEKRQIAAHEMLTRSVKNAIRALEEREIRHDQYMQIIMRRRSFVYNLPQRIDKTVELVKENPNDRIIIFSERLDQINKIMAKLFAEGIGCSIYTSEFDTLKSYLDHETRVLVTSKMIKEGFNDPTTTLGIVASTPLSQRNHVQTIGRIIRAFPGKIAKIYILLASGTSDMKLANKKYESWGKKYSQDYKGNVFVKKGHGRLYCSHTPLNLQAILENARGGVGGVFYISENGDVRVRGQVVGKFTEKLVFDEAEKLSCPRHITFEELFGSCEENA